MPYTNAPYWALTLTSIVIAMIMPLRHFKTILGVDIDLYCLALLLEIASFIRLRYTQPERPREYRVPVEGVWMWLLFFPMAVITVSSEEGWRARERESERARERESKRAREQEGERARGRERARERARAYTRKRA